MILLDDKAFLKFRYFLLEFDKANSKFNLFSRKDLILQEGVSANDLIDGVAIISGKEGTDGFTLKDDILLDTEGLGGESRKH